MSEPGEITASITVDTTDMLRKLRTMRDLAASIELLQLCQEADELLGPIDPDEGDETSRQWYGRVSLWRARFHKLLEEHTPSPRTVAEAEGD